MTTPIIITPLLHAGLNSNLSLNDIAKGQAGIHDDFEIIDFNYNVSIIPKLLKNNFEDLSFTGLSVPIISIWEGGFLPRNVLLCEVINLLTG